MALATLRRWARELRQSTLVVYFAARDPRTRWWVRVLALLVAAYALSPIDLIPDFIPVLGYLDDPMIVPLGVLLVLKLIPPEVTRAAKEQALAVADMPTSRIMAAVVVVVWLIAAGLFGAWAWRASGR